MSILKFSCFSVVAFIRISPPVNPSKLVHHMLTELKETQKYMTRYISRFLPVEKSCNAHIADIEVAAKALFEPHFTQKDSEGNLISRKVCQYFDLQEKKNTKSLQ